MTLPVCHCGQPLISTAEIESGPRRLWRCADGHEEWRTLSDPPPAPETSRPGQMELL